MRNQVNIGVVGCGYWGPNLVRNFRSLPDCRLKSMCDLSEDRLRHLRSLYPEVQGDTSYSIGLSKRRTNFAAEIEEAAIGSGLSSFSRAIGITRRRTTKR